MTNSMGNEALTQPKIREVEPLRLKTAGLAHFIVIVSRRRHRYGSFLFLELHPNQQF